MSTIQPEQPFPTTAKWSLKRDILFLILFGALGTAAAYLSINIPHSELFIEVRWLFGFMGFVLIRRLPLALVLPVILSLAGFHEVPLHVALLGNLFYALPFSFCLRFFYRRVLIKLENMLLSGVLWLAAVRVGYQLFTNPFTWIVVGILRDALSTDFVIEVYTIQPYIEESLAVAFISGLGLTIIRMYITLRNRERHLATILHSIGDGVIVTDETGRIELMNPVAETLTGWSKNDAEELPLPEVFHIVNAKSGVRSENPVSKVLKQGIVVGLANHTMLISKTGEKYQIADSGAPIYDDTGTIKGVVLVFRDVTDEYAIRKRIETELKEKAILLQEVHHRVKNNLQIISSLLNLQSASLSDAKVSALLEDSKNRIFSMALVHNQLYQTGNFSGIDFRAYVEQLCDELFAGNVINTEVKISLDISDITLALQQAIPCGLILNEMITNSLKHAFKNQKEGEIFISFHLNEKEKKYVLHYKDNGKGIEHSKRAYGSDNLGMFLIDNLTEQIGGAVELENLDKGLGYSIVFPL